MTTLWFDTETFSTVPIKRGHHAYAEAAEIMVAAWALDDGPIVVEDLTVLDADGDVTCRMPSEDLIGHLRDPRVEVVIQNSQFDRTVMRHWWGIDLPVSRIHDTMVQAMVHSLPGALGKLSELYNLGDDAKDEGGKKLIQLFCQPRPKNMKVRRATKATHPAEWAEFLSYAGSDIRSMRALRAKLPRWNYADSNQHRELSLWRLDQRINDRGFAVDVDMAQRAIETITREQKTLKAQTQELTNDEVSSASKRDELLTHIFTEYGVNLPDLKKDTLERRLKDPELPDALKQLIRVRLATSTTSTAKYQAIIRSVSSDGRMRGTTAFCGALRTGRWAGRLFQPQNLPRPDAKQPEIDSWIEALKADALDLVEPNVMRALSNCLRGLIVAAPGRKIVASDLSNIEGRTGAWLAGEQWKLDAFAEIDAAKRAGQKVADMYQRAFGQMFGVDPLGVADDDRQVGKVSELANGYEGGVGAALAFAAVYRLDLDALAEEAHPRLPEAARTQAEIMLDWRKKKNLSTFGLKPKTFVVFEAFKALWRQAHPATSSYWGELNDAAIEAVRTPGKTIECRRLAFDRKGAWLRMVLPSGRALCYPSPQVKVDGRRETLTYMGVNQYNRRWARLSTYGGKLFENANQAVARDVMADRMPSIEEAGFPILLTVHDEIITEPLDKAELTSDSLSSLLATNPSWLPGCPLAASGFEAPRYRKD